MITCVVEYTIDSRQIPVFEEFARAWIALVNSRGGQHHGYPEFIAADRIRDDSGCVLRWERSFMRPLLTP